MPVYTLPNVRDGRKVVAAAGTRVQLVATDTPAKLVTVMAMPTNTDIVVLGGSTVVAGNSTDSGAVRRGVPLNPGQSITLNVENLLEIYLDSVVSGEGVTYLYQF